MSSIKISESINNSKKSIPKHNKISNKLVTNIIDNKKSFDNVIADINLDLMKINKKLEKHSNYQENIQSLLEEEIKLRQDIEKKTFLINENLNSEITKIKFSTSNFTQTMNETLKENLKKLNDENLNNKSDLNKIKEEIDKKMLEYEEKIKKTQEEKSLKMLEIEERIKSIEENNLTQFQNLQKEHLTNRKELNDIKNLLKNNNILINDEINIIKKDMTFIKNEIQNLKGAKVNMNSDLNRIIKETEKINQNFEKIINDLNNTKIEIQTKINNYEASNRLFQQNFMDLKDDLLNHLDEINNINKDDIIKIREETFGQIKQIKNDMNQFNLNIIKENQKFIDYSQNELQEHDNNLKKLFEYTSDDIEVLKKKSDTLESLIKNTRNEMINNINSVEGFLSNRYDSIFKSISSDRNINKF